MTTLPAVALRPGQAGGRLLVLTEPLSFWGGVDAGTGRIVDVRHAQHGADISNTILAVAECRGSLSSSSVLAECFRRRTGPGAIILREVESTVVVASLVVDELYGITIPVVVLPHGWDALCSGTRADVSADEPASVTLAP